MNKLFRVGGIGTGQIFHDGHVPVYATRADVQLTALFDPNQAAAERARDHYQQLRSQAFPQEKHPEIVLYTSAQDLLKQVDMVDICTTVRYHAYYAAMALKANVHTMTEIPFARTWWEANYVAEQAKNSKAFFQLNDDNIFIPRYQAIRHVIESGLIGEPQNIWITRGCAGSERPGWFWTPLEAGGGCIFDYGSHAVMASWFLLGFDKIPVEARSLGIEVRNRTRLIDGRLRPIEIDDDAHFKIRYLNPANDDWITVNIETTWTWPDWSDNGGDVRGFIEVQGSLGTVTGFVNEKDEDFVKITRRGFTGERLLPIESACSKGISFHNEITNFIECMRAGTPSLLNVEVAAAVIRTINCAQLSELRGRISITGKDLEIWSRKIAKDSPNPWEAGDRIAVVINAPHQLKSSRMAS
jgi:predicted dehydrogenase